MKSGGVMCFNKYCGKMHCETVNNCHNIFQNVKGIQTEVSEDARYLFWVADRTCAVLIQVRLYSLLKVCVNSTCEDAIECRKLGMQSASVLIIASVPVT
ncbi:hypothetical protein HanIR_Chr14g0727381 [Helianthus annuus]|nr:hypothetical protein HanIR_Chr14g0727381 [Helianthus annuus]